MRRPTAELVDAVAAEERARQARVAKAEKQQLEGEPIKREDSGNDLPMWKINDSKDNFSRRDDPASPLGIKTGETSHNLPSNITTERRGRTSSAPLSQEDDRPLDRHSGAASAIAALANKHQVLRTKDQDQRSSNDLENKALSGSAERSSIFDFTGSSPNNDEDPTDKAAGARVIKPARTSRRHSSVPTDLQKGKSEVLASRRGDRRREVTATEPKEAGSGNPEAPEKPLSRTKSVLEVNTGAEGTLLDKKDRAASRRRSMML